MSRVRVSTTVDGKLLRAARAAVGGADSHVLETALKALLWSYRSAAVDSAYETAYALTPLTTSATGATWNRGATPRGRREPGSKDGEAKRGEPLR